MCEDLVICVVRGFVVLGAGAESQKNGVYIVRGMVAVQV